MKYIQYFKENSNSFNKDIVFDNEDWLVIKPSNYKSMCYWGQDTDWRLSDGNHEYYFVKNKCYVIINKEKNNKWFFNFNDNEFLDSHENQIYIREFLDNDKSLYNFFGDQIECKEIVEVGGEWWFVIDEYSYFEDFFELSSKTRSDLIKLILGDETWQIFQYDSNSFNISDEYIKLEDKNLILLKTVLFLEQKHNNYDYNILEIKDYRDVVSVIKENDLESIESVIQRSIREGHENADADAAWEDIVDEIYDFFNLVDGSAKWDYYQGSTSQMLWIRFKNKYAAIYAKYRISNFENEWDDMIKYYPPDYGWYGKSETVQKVFNEVLLDRIDEYDDHIDSYEIDKYYGLWKKLKDEGMKEENILNELELRINVEKYNL